MSHALKASLTAAALLLSQTSTADVVTLDPTAFSSGTDISNAFEGVSLATLSIPQYPTDYSWPDNVPALQVSAVYAGTTVNATIPCTGCPGAPQAVFSPTETGSAPAYNFSDKVTRQMTQESGPQLAGSQALLVNFDSATDHVEVAGGNSNSGNYFRLDIWNLAGELMGTCSNASLNSSGCTAEETVSETWVLSFTSALADIAYITTGGWGGGEYVSAISFNSAAVPEPAAPAILAIGLTALMLGRRKSRDV